MSSSLIDCLSPEDHAKLAYAAWAVLLLGLALWSCGVTFARGAVAAVLGTALMIFGLWFPGKIGVVMSPYLTGGLGFAIGAIIGGLGFRLVQAATLAACLGLAVAGLYYQWHVRHPPTAPTVVASRPAETLMVQVKPIVTPSVYGALDAIGRRIANIPKIHLQRMAIAGGGSALIAILFAMGFPRATTTLITSILGTICLMASVYSLVHAYSPTLSGLLPSGAVETYAILLVFTAIGLAIQYRFFLRLPDKSPESA
jgi:hypothetical protein